MNQNRQLWPSIVAVAVLAIAMGSAQAQSAKDLVGTWTVVSITGEDDPNPRGMLTFDAGGRFVQVNTRSDLPKYASGKRSEGTAAEYKAIALGSIGFFGSYTVDGTNLIRHVEGSTIPNMVGSDQKLVNLTLTGDELKWTNPTPPSGGALIVVSWKRAK